MSILIASISIGYAPAVCAASTKKRIPRVLAIRPISATGRIVRRALEACCRAIIRVAGRGKSVILDEAGIACPAAAAAFGFLKWEEHWLFPFFYNLRGMYSRMVSEP